MLENAGSLLIGLGLGILIARGYPETHGLVAVAWFIVGVGALLKLVLWSRGRDDRSMAGAIPHESQKERNSASSK